MPRVADNLRILERLAEAFNDHDLDRIMTFFAEDCSLGTKQVCRSPDRSNYCDAVSGCRAVWLSICEECAYTHQIRR